MINRKKRRNLIISAIAVVLVLIVGTVIVRQRHRAFFYPSPGAMPPAVADDMGAALRRFELALANHAPQALEALQPGLAESEIITIQREHGLMLTEDMKALYRWRNGCPPDARRNLIPGHRFVPLKEAILNRDDLRRQVADSTPVQRAANAVFAGHKDGWIHILDDTAGDGYFYDPSRSRGSFFYHFAEDGQYRFFPSLANFLVGAAECLETGIYKSDAQGNLEEDFMRSHLLWPRYASW